MTKNREKVSESTLEQAICDFREMVLMLRGRCINSGAAIYEVAKIVGLSPRRGKDLFYRNVWTFWQDEADRIETRYIAQLAREIEIAEANAEQLRKKRDARVECRTAKYVSASSGADLAGPSLRSAA